MGKQLLGFHLLFMCKALKLFQGDRFQLKNFRVTVLIETSWRVCLAPLPLFVQSMIPLPQAFPDGILELEPSVTVRPFVYGNSGQSLG